MHKLTKFLLLIAIIAMGNSCADDKKDYLVTIETNFGNMKLVLFDETPLHKENFIKLAEEGRYDSTIFHRVIKGFMVQGGDIDTKEGNTPSSTTIPAEFVKKHFHRKGALAAARQSDQINPKKASSWSQFYIVQGEKFPENQLSLDQQKFGQYFRQFLNLEKSDDLKAELEELYTSGQREAYQDRVYGLVGEIEKEFSVSLKKDIAPERLEAYSSVGGAPHLDDQYTVFGMVVEGLEVIDAIADQETAAQDKPVDPIYMKVSVEKLSKSKITKAYGFEYPAK